jgi:hypothetical protein
VLLLLLPLVVGLQQRLAARAEAAAGASLRIRCALYLLLLSHPQVLLSQQQQQQQRRQQEVAAVLAGLGVAMQLRVQAALIQQLHLALLPVCLTEQQQQQELVVVVACVAAAVLL